MPSSFFLPSAKFIAAVTALVAAGVAAPALAHPKLVSATPAQGATVKSPKEIRVEFSQPVAADTATFEIANDAAKPFKLGAIKVDPKEEKALIVPVVGKLPAGAYVVKWTVVASGHAAVPGVLRFQVGR